MRHVCRVPELLAGPCRPLLERLPPRALLVRVTGGRCGCHRHVPPPPGPVRLGVGRVGPRRVVPSPSPDVHPDLDSGLRPSESTPLVQDARRTVVIAPSSLLTCPGNLHGVMVLGSGAWPGPGPLRGASSGDRPVIILQEYARICKNNDSVRFLITKYC